MKPLPLLTVSIVALLITGCTGGEPADTSGSPGTGMPSSSSGSSGDAGPSTSAASPSSTSSPSPGPTTPSASASPALTATIPTDCRAIVPAERYDAVFGTTPLNHPDMVDPAYVGAVDPIESYAGAPAQQVLSDATRLRCEWRDPRADITGLTLEVAQADPAVADVYLDEREIAGDYECQTVHEGRRCQLIGQNEMYPVEQAETLFIRDDVFIRVMQFNFATNDLLGDVVDAVWN